MARPDIRCDGFTLHRHRDRRLRRNDQRGKSDPACDDLIDRLVRAKAEPAFASVDCGLLKKVGVDKLEHELKRVCYSSNGPTSRIEVEGSITCKTSDRALIKSSATGSATATAEVRGKDCQITSFSLQPSGDLAQAIVSVFKLEAKLKDSLQKSLTDACR